MNQLRPQTARKRRCLKPQNMAGDGQPLTVLNPNQVLFLRNAVTGLFDVGERV